MNNGWIKLHRAATEHPVFDDDKAFKVFVWLLTHVDRQTGKMTTGRNWVAEAININPNTFYNVLKRLEKKYKIITQETNNRFTTISLLNWAKYQQTTELSTQGIKNKTKTNQEPLNTLQEVENIRSKEEERARKYLINIPLEDFSDIDATEKQIRLEGEKAYNWCLAKGKVQKNYKAFLRNWVLKVYKKRVAAQPTVEYEIDPEGIARIKEMKAAFKLN